MANECEIQYAGNAIAQSNDIKSIHNLIDGTYEGGQSTGLEDYLKKKSEGKIILKSYKESLSQNIPLKKTIRSRLVRLVIGREKDNILKNVDENEALEKFEIKKQRFQILANEITTIFKGENSSTYFTSFIKQGDKSVLANGKLWHHYNYVKFCLREANILKQSVPKNPTITLNGDELQYINDNEDIAWLGQFLEPWNELLVKWKRSFILRRNLLKESNISVNDYINKFPCLSIQEGKELFIMDFDSLYPENPFITVDKWKKIKTFLISYLDTVHIKNFDESVLVRLLTTGDLNTDREDFLVFYLLCHIIKPTRNRKRNHANQNKPMITLSLQERRETFILRVEIADDIQIKLLDLRKRLMQDCKTFQPVIVAVGAASCIREYHVVLNGKLYDVESSLEAVQLALRIFFSLNCNHPENSNTIWVFLQKVLLNIYLPLDIVSVDSNILLGRIRDL